MKIEIKPSAGVFIALMAVFFQAWLGWLQGIIAALLLSGCVLAHEIAHLAVAHIFRVTVRKIGFGVEAAYLVRARSPDRRAEAMIAAAGPLTNLLLFSGLLLARGRLGYWLAFCNLVLFVFNLLPFGPTDGRRLLMLFRSAPPKQL